MKKIYEAPIFECLAFCSATAISVEEEEFVTEDSRIYNNGELGWT